MRKKGKKNKQKVKIPIIGVVISDKKLGNKIKWIKKE